MPGTIQCPAYGRDLPVHHPAGCRDVGTSVGLCDRGTLVQAQGCVVVDRSVRPEHAAVAVVRVLVDAQVGDEDHVVAHLLAQVGERQLDDAMGIPRTGPFGILAARNSEQDHARDAEPSELRHLLAERITGVLHDARETRDRLRLADALPHEERRDEIIDRHARLGNQPTQSRGAAEPAQPALGEGHPSQATGRRRAQRGEAPSAPPASRRRGGRG